MLDHVAALAADSERIAVVGATTPPDARVPSCPEWALRDLLVHVGRVQRFWAAVVRAGDGAGPRHGGPRPSPPSDDRLAAWVREGTDELVAAVRAADGRDRCWTWWGEPRPVAAATRHQVQEAAVHRWDAELAAGSPAPLDAEVAHDGVAEFLQVALVGTPAARVELVAIDTGGRWVVGAGTGPVDATLRATASDLVLLLYGRTEPGALDVDGDAGAVARLLAARRDLVAPAPPAPPPADAPG